MRSFLYLLVLMSCICGCKKKEIVDIQADSFRISIIPVADPAFNKYSFIGTLEVRQVTGNVEYGLVAGKTQNPDINIDKIFKTGNSANSVDFSQIISGLDTGAVYHVRAYARSKTETQYSADQIISKLSPKLYANTATLQYGQVFSFSTNFSGTGNGTLPTVRLNNIVVGTSGGAANGGTALAFSLTPSDDLPIGPYTLSVEIDGVKIIYPTPLTLVEGHWTQPYILPRDYVPYSIFDKYVIGDWIYNIQYYIGHAGSVFSRYNYKTGETQNLTALPSTQTVQGATMFQNGNQLHVLGGELIGIGGVDRPMSSAHWIYDLANDTWTREPSDLPGKGRRNAALMQVGNKLYYGLGTDLTASASGYFSGLADLWVYDPVNGKWQQLTNFPGAGQYSRSYFNLEGKLYVVGGVNQGTAIKECWCYDPAGNKWSRRQAYPGSGSVNLLTFSIGNYGYAGTGETSSYDSYFGRNLFPEIYKYDAINDKWTEVSNFGGGLIQPFVANLGTSVLIGAGVNAHSVLSPAIFEFRP